MPLVEPQAVLAPLTESAIFLVATVAVEGSEAVRELLPDVGGLTRSVGFRAPEGELSCVVGLGSTLWDRMFAGPRPQGLHPFAAVAGSRHRAEATPGDLLFHIRARRLDLCFELAQHLMGRLAGCAEVVDEVHGFRSFDDRDLLGFVDGTENPTGAAARAAALIGDEDVRFAGGSYAVVQKYLHDLAGWDELSVSEQELRIGRSKLGNLEIPERIRPADAHVALNTIVDQEGRERKILRYNMPFGRVGAGEFGTYFIGYSRSPDVPEQMLRNMFVGKPPGNHDRILDYSRPVTGSLFFVPPADLLDDPPEPPMARTEAGEPGS